MNIKKIPITDNLSEQVKIGKEISEIYDDDMMRYVVNVYDNFKHWDEVCPIPKEQMVYKYIYDYFVYGFSPDQEIYLKLYNKSHVEKSKYLSFRNKFLYFARLNKKSEMHMLEDKYEAYCMLGKYYGREVVKIETENDFNLFEDFIIRHPIFVSKPLGLSCAMGVQKINANEYTDKRALFNTLVNVGQKYANDFSVKGDNHNGAVLEEVIVQDKDFAMIHPYSVNGIRVTTIRINGKIHIYYPWIKVGVNHDFVASAASGGFDAGIDTKTGVVNTNGFLEDGSEIEYHPDTKVKIKGYQIPKWQELIDLSTEVAMSLKDSINYVGWDFVLTPTGWIVMEGNFYGDAMWQMFLKKGMKEDLERLLGWKPDGRFWWQYNIKKLEQEV